MKRLLFLICIIVCLVGCISNNTNRSQFTEQDVNTVKITDAQSINPNVNGAIKIDLNEVLCDNVFNEYDIIDTMFFLPLRTKPESVFFEPDRIYFGNERIFIKDYKNNVVIFDDKGNYVNSLKKGEGPGEINMLVAIAFDETTQQLVVLQADKMLSFFDKDGRFIGKTNRCPLNTRDFFITKWGYLFFQSTFENIHLGDNAKNALLLANDSLNVVYKGLNVMEGYNYVHCGSMVFPTVDSYYVTQFFNDTIYEVSKNELSPIKVKYIIDYNEKKAVNNNNLVMSDKFYNGSCVMENSKTQLFRFWSPRRGMCFVIRDISTGKTIGGTGVNYDMNIIPDYFDMLLAVHNDYFVSFIESYKGMHYDSPAISDADNQKIAGRDEEDNYVLAFFKFKAIK